MPASKLLLGSILSLYGLTSYGLRQEYFPSITQEVAEQESNALIQSFSDSKTIDYESKQLAFRTPGNTMVYIPFTEFDRDLVSLLPFEDQQHATSLPKDGSKMSVGNFLETFFEETLDAIQLATKEWNDPDQGFQASAAKGYYYE